MGGPEERLVPAAGFDLATISVRGLDRDAVWKNVALPVIIPAALRAGLRIVDRFKPDIVLGMGGYVMAPSHRSMMDIPFAGWLTRRRLRYMGKQSLFDVPVLGWLFTVLGGFPVDQISVPEKCERLEFS